MERSCGSCGKPLVSENPRARYCGVTCRANASKRRSAGVQVLRASVGAPASRSTAPLEGQADGADGPVAARTRRELAEAGREDSALGQAALVMAWRLDQRADTASAMAAGLKQLEATLSSAVRGATVVSSPLDELRARRDAKRGA